VSGPVSESPAAKVMIELLKQEKTPQEITNKYLLSVFKLKLIIKNG